MIITNKNNYYSFVIVLPGGHKSISLHIPRWGIVTGVGVVIIGIIVLGTGIYFTSTTNYKNQAYTKLKVENKHLKSELSQIHDTVNQLQSQYIQIFDKEDELKLLLGGTKRKKRNYRQRRRLKKKITKIKKQYNKINAVTTDKIKQAQLKIALLQKQMTEKNKTFTFFLDKTYQLKNRFASTPSIRPIYGRIQSQYGMRYHPIHRRKKFHKGIDFASWSGAPIQATADGIIEYAGWSGSFGFVIVIDHDYGYRTIYAHCSQLLVEQGVLIKKGQIIAQVGTTGISTGSHLHYEIKKWRKSVNPIAYLDIDMFTASKKIW